jgi:hypothetical protein
LGSKSPMGGNLDDGEQCEHVLLISCVFSKN